mgnify:CR=1 FL=1
MGSHGVQIVKDPKNSLRARNFKLFAPSCSSAGIKQIWDNFKFGRASDLARSTETSLSEQNSLDSQQEFPEAVARDRLTFSLKFLPKTMTQEEVMAKILKFGEVSQFNFFEERAVTKKEQRGCFKRAEFTFADLEAERTFQTVKRIRIKGLQVKVGVESDPAESIRIEPNHCVKPTCRLFVSRLTEGPIRFNTARFFGC